MSSRRPLPLPPLWARWALAVLVAAGIVAAVIVAFSKAGPDGATSEAGAEAEANRIADIAISEDQAPRSASLPAGATAVRALQQAIAGDVRHRIAGGQLTGPLNGVSCAAAGAGSAGGRPYRCTVRSAGISYPFLAVVNEDARKLTWCKVDQAPVAGAGPEVPVSSSCRA